MTEPTSLAHGLVQGAATLSFLMLLIGVLFSFIRIVKGPSLPDRVVALDMLSMLLVSFAGVAAVAFDQVAFLEVAITLALLAFIATVALARYAERDARATALEESERAANGGGNP